MTKAKGQWFIKVQETIYGPYSQARMAAFVAEGRLSARSMVCATKHGDFGPAGEVPDLQASLAQIIPDEDANMAPAAKPDSGSSDSGSSPSVSSDSGSSDSGRRFVIFAQVGEQSRSVFLNTLGGFGIAFEVLPNVWLLSAAAEADRLRNAMSQVLGREDSLFIADASNGISAWFNIGQEADGRIRQFWQDSK